MLKLLEWIKPGERKSSTKCDFPFLAVNTCLTGCLTRFSGVLSGNSLSLWTINCAGRHVQAFVSFPARRRQVISIVWLIAAPRWVVSDKAPHCLDNRPVNGYRGAQTGWTALAPANKGGRYAGRTGHAAAEVWCEGRAGEGRQTTGTRSGRTDDRLVSSLSRRRHWHVAPAMVSASASLQTDTSVIELSCRQEFSQRTNQNE